MIPAYLQGQVINPTGLDFKALDTLGYDPTNAVTVTEPQGIARLIIGLLSLGWMRRARVFSGG